jgi:hypothetical protein
MVNTYVRGLNEYGQLGDGTDVSRGDDAGETSSIEYIPFTELAIDITAYYLYVCAFVCVYIYI